MTARCAILLVGGNLDSEAAPPGIARIAFGRAMFSDVAEILHELSGVDSLVVCPAEQRAEIEPLVWAGVPVVASTPAGVPEAVQVALGRSYTDAVVVTADVPDLPQMILAKMFQALSTSPVAVAPADGGGAVALGVRLPLAPWVPGWLDAADFDARSVVDRARAAAPDPGQVRVTPGWHRISTAADVHRLDPGLEGWESTRALVSGLRIPGEA